MTASVLETSCMFQAGIFVLVRANKHSPSMEAFRIVSTHVMPQMCNASSRGGCHNGKLLLANIRGLAPGSLIHLFGPPASCAAGTLPDHASRAW